jgi:isocitrate dehydrogenase
MYEHITPPANGEAITRGADGRLQVPDRPVIPYIEGDGTGPDIVTAMRRVVDAAVDRAYGAKRAIEWMEIYAGEKAAHIYGQGQWLPDETVAAAQHYLVSIKGPLTATASGSMRSLSAALRQRLDCYACIRPVRYFRGAPSPLKDASNVDMVLVRETSEDIYAGIQWAADSPEARKLIGIFREELGVTAIRFPDHCAIGVKPISREGSTRLIRRAIQYAIQFERASVTMVHKSTVMNMTEGAFLRWGYELAQNEFGAQPAGAGAWLKIKAPHGEIVIKDCIVDAFMQQSLTRPGDFDVLATMSQHGDYISAALAAQIGGVGLAPGANLSDSVAMFEPAHGSAPHYGGQDLVNPGATILSAQMMLAHIGWGEAAAVIVDALERTIMDKHVTYDLARQMAGATQVSCSGFARAMIERMKANPGSPAQPNGAP